MNDWNRVALVSRSFSFSLISFFYCCHVHSMRTQASPPTPLRRRACRVHSWWNVVMQISHVSQKREHAFVCLFHVIASTAEAQYCNYEPKKAQQHLFPKILFTKICTNDTKDSSGVLCSVILERNLFCKSCSILIYFLLIIFLHGSSLFIVCLVFIVLQLKR